MCSSCNHRDPNFWKDRLQEAPTNTKPQDGRWNPNPQPGKFYRPPSAREIINSHRKK